MTFHVKWSTIRWKLILILVLMFALMEFCSQFYHRDRSRSSIGNLCGAQCVKEGSIAQDNAIETSPVYNKEETNSTNFTTDSTLESSPSNFTEVNDNMENGTDIESDDEGSDDDYSFTLVTGASENHFCVLQSWLYSTSETLQQFEPSKRPRVIIYDLGLTDNQRSHLQISLDQNMFQELRLFDYSNYPSFWNIAENRGQYAWKVGIVSEIARDYPGIVMWLDAGSWIEEYAVSNISSIVDSYNGFASPVSAGRIPNWTHPGVFDYFHESPQKYSNYRNCNGAVLIFDTSRTQSLIDAWLECALVEDCIAPNGSSRENHRQDQAILSFLAARANLRCSRKPEYLGVIAHQDGECKQKVIEYQLNHPEVRWHPSVEGMEHSDDYEEEHPEDFETDTATEYFVKI